MSHFTVLVCLGPERIKDHGGHLRAALAAVLAPYDESKDVDPYRSFEKGEPGKHWFVDSMRGQLSIWRRIQEIGERAVRAELIEKYAKRNESRAFLTERDKPENQADADIAYATFAGANPLPDEPTWADVAAVYNKRYHDKPEPEPDEDGAIDAEIIAVDGKPMLEAGGPPLDDDGELDTERLYVVPDDDPDVDNRGRAYTWSRYNPASRWDWYLVGGRWQRSLLALPGTDETELIFGEPGTGGDDGSDPTHDEVTGGRWCDGLPRRALDIGRMRDRVAERTLADYDAWQAIVAEHGPGQSWASLRTWAQAEEITWDEARKTYHTQPAIVAAREAGIDHEWSSDDPVEAYAVTREEIEQRARNSAVPGFALVDVDGEWIEAGKMGWFAVHNATPDGRVAYQRAASEYIDGLDGDVMLVMVDCHI